LKTKHLKESKLLLETIKCEDGKVFNIHYHQDRCNKSRSELYSSTNILDLASAIVPPKKGLYRCRIVYAEHIQSIEYIPYIEKQIKTLKVVSSSLEYAFKYANRDTIDLLLSNHNDVDEIIIEKNGYLCDTSIANIAFYDGSTWYTPSTPLFKGTMRQKLIDEGLLQTKHIKREDLSNYSQVALINAMIGFKILNHFNIVHN